LVSARGVVRYPRRIQKITFLAFALLLGMASIRGVVVPPQASMPTAVVVGVVLDQTTGRPIPDAIVTVAIRTAPGAPAVSGPNVPQQVMTDPTGRFAFTELPGGAFVISATKAGYLPTDFQTSLNLDLRNAERITNATLSLTKFASISGRVLDDLGDPVVGVTVRAHRRGFAAGHPRLDYGQKTGRTDDRGIYRIATLSPGEYVVAVPAIQVAVPVSTVTDFMTGNRGATGAFLDALGTAAISVIGSPSAAMGSTGAQRMGNVVLQSPPGTYYSPDSGDPSRATAYRTTFAPSTAVPSDATVVILQPGEHRSGVDVQLALVPTVRVTGSVAGPDGAAPLVALRLMIPSGELPDDPDLAPAAAVSDASGAFTFLNVPAGQYVLRAFKRPSANEGLPETYRLWAEDSLTVGTMPMDGVRVTLRRPFTVTGRVVFEGASPQPSAQELTRPPQPLLILATVDARDISFAFVDATGAFATRPVPGGRYLLTSTTTIGPWSLKSATWQGRDITRSPIELKDDEVSGVVATFTDRPARIAGTVRNTQGAPDKGATVLLFPADAAAWTDYGYRPRQVLSVSTSLTGTYAFPRVPAGDYFLVAATERTGTTGTTGAAGAIDATTPPSVVDLPGSLRDWQNPAFLAAVSKAAVRVRVTEGEAQTQDLKTTVIR
jgi:hypothetical protein